MNEQEHEDSWGVIVNAVDKEQKPSCWGNLKDECKMTCKHYDSCVNETVRRDCQAGRD